MRFSFLGAALIAGGLIGGCDDEGDNAWPPLGGGSSGEGGSAGQSGGAGEGGGDSGPGVDDLSELRALEACDVPEPCLESFVQLIEQQTHYYRREAVGCLMGALAARRPGRYVHRTDATFSNGSTAAKHVLVVAADGTVAYLRDPSQSFQEEAGSRETALPPDRARRCRLKPASYFEACRASVEALPDERTSSGDGTAWACTFGDGQSLRPSTLDWFESCEPESPPRCESGSAPVGPPDAGPSDAGSPDGGLSNHGGADASADAAP